MVTVISKEQSAAFKNDVALISTSDRSAFRSCRRKWNWSSHLRESLAALEQRAPLWFGSGMHHALEDYHGLHLYKTLDDAIDDYVQATSKHYGIENLPPTVEDDTILMKRMLQHYTVGWIKLRNRDPLRTYVVNGEPQVEVPFEFEIPLSKSFLQSAGYRKAIYKGVLDRVVIDDDGYLWIQDYKNVARFTEPLHLELDSQIGVYMWAATYIYKKPVLGFIYTQFFKKGVEAPRLLKDNTLSVAQDQNTNHDLYRAKLIEMYGAAGPWPEKNVQMLNTLAAMESEEADKYIRRDRVTRNRSTLAMESNKIIMEVSEMLNPKIALYPNPTSFPIACSATCSYLEPCLQMDRGEDYQATLRQDYKHRDYTERNTWRQYLQLGSKEDKKIIEVSAPDPATKLKKKVLTPLPKRG